MATRISRDSLEGMKQTADLKREKRESLQKRIRELRAREPNLTVGAIAKQLGTYDKLVREALSAEVPAASSGAAAEAER